MSFQWHIEVFDKLGARTDILQSDVFALAWSYSELGGCGEARIGLRREFDDYGDLARDYRVEIWRDIDQAGAVVGGARFDAGLGQGPVIGTTADLQPVFSTNLDALGRAVITQATAILAGVMSDGTAWFLKSEAAGAQLPIKLFGMTGASELRWSGFLRELVPVFDEQESVALNCSGYVRQAEYIHVDDRTYTGDVAAIARDVIDNFLISGTQIKRTVALHLCVHESGIQAVGLYFDTSAAAVLSRLAELGGNMVWGIRADREVFFCPAPTSSITPLS